MSKKSFFSGLFCGILLTIMAVLFISATQSQQTIDKGSLTKQAVGSPMFEKLNQLEEKLNQLNERTVRIEETTNKTFNDLHRMWKELYELCKK